MLLYAELEQLEAALRKQSAPLAGMSQSDQSDQNSHWGRVEKLSRSLRQSWLRVCTPITLNDAPVELAAGWVSGAPVAVVATATGHVGLLRLDEVAQDGGEPQRAIDPDKSVHMRGFDANTDEVRNILLSPRRYSSEVDVFITVRRWPQGGGDASHHLWRGILWRDDDVGGGRRLHHFRTVVEHRGPDRPDWLEVPPPDTQAEVAAFRDFLDWACDIPVQWSVDDALSTDAQPCVNSPERRALLLALSRITRARLDTDGKLQWYRSPKGDRADEQSRVFEPPQPPVAMALSDTGQHLVVASANGRLLRYDSNNEPEPHDLEAGVAVLAVVPAAPREHAEAPQYDPLEILVAHRGGRLALWRWVGRERLDEAWRAVVAERREALPRVDYWKTWVESGSSRDATECRQLLWLHAAWQQPDLLDGFCAVSHARGPHSIGVRIGQELVALLREHADTQSRQCAMSIYNAGGLALREQVDRANVLSAVAGQHEDELGRRSRTNYWDHGNAAPGADDSMQRTAIGNLATRPYLYEACWKPGARFVGAMCTQGEHCTHSWLVVALDKRLCSLSMPACDAPIDADVRRSAPPLLDVELPDGALPLPWAWVRSLHGGGARHAVMLGGRGGMVLVRPAHAGADRPVLRAHAVPCRPSEEGLTAINLEPPSADRLHLGLVWAAGPRVRIQRWAVDLRAAQVTASNEPEQDVPVAARMLDVVEIDGVPWMAAGTRLPNLEWLRFDKAKEPSGTWERIGPSMALKGAVVGLRFATGWVDGAPAPVLVLSTQAGWVWCVDARRRRVLWLRHVGESIAVLDVTGEGEGLRILVCAAPHWWCLFDAQGRRLWRHRIGPHAADAVMLPCIGAEMSSSPGRLALVDADGGLSIFRNARAEWPDWRGRAKGLSVVDPHDSDPDRIRAAQCIAKQRYAELDDLRAFERPEPRRAVLAESVAAGTGLAHLLRLPDIGPDDIAAMARELPADRPIADWEALWEHALRLFDDDNTASHGEMLVELLAWLHRRRVPADFLAARLADLRRRPRSMAAQALVNRDAAVQAAHAWIDPAPGTAMPDAEAVLRGLHRLPPEAAYQLPLFLRRARLSGWLKALARTALHDNGELSIDVFADELPADGDEKTRKGSPMQTALEAALRLAAWKADGKHQRDHLWGAASELLLASRRVELGPGALIAALREPAAQAPPDVLQDTWRLERQRDWLMQALDRHWRLPSSSDDVEDPRWSTAMQRLMAAVEVRFRRGLEKRLATVVARSRPHLDAEVLRWIGDEALVSLRICHDGRRTLPQPHIEIALLGERAGDRPEDAAPPLLWSWNPTQLAPGDPVHEARLALTPPRGEPRLRLVCRAEGRKDVTEWPLDLGKPRYDPEPRSLLLSEPLRGGLVERIRALRGGVATLALDSPLAPEAVVPALGKESMTTRDLDAALHELGPGRAYPRDLDLSAILRAIDGHPVRDKRMEYSQTYQPERWPHGGVSPVLLYPCGDLVRRLLDDAALEMTREHLWDGLRKRARARTTPAWIWVLPSALAARWHAAMADAGAMLIHPAHVPPDLLDDEAFTLALAAHLGKDRRSARQSLLEAGYDLRTLLAPGERREAVRLSWIRADLCGLQARELAALLGLAGARTRMPLERIPSGAVADETVETVTTKPGRRVKVLVRAGDVAFNPRRMMAIRKDLTVRGLGDALDTSAMSASAQQMLLLSGFRPETLQRLERLGLVQTLSGLRVLRADLTVQISRLRAVADAVDEFAALTACMRMLADEDVWWHALHLPALVRTEAQDLAALGLAKGDGRLALFHAVGSLWAEEELTANHVNTLVLALTATPARRIDVHSSQYAVAQSGTAVRLPHSDDLAIHVVASAAMPSEAAQADADAKIIRVWLGPGSAGLPKQAGVRIGDAQMRDILRSPKPQQAFWACVRAQCDLRRLSPFVHSGSLPPGSPLFVGRRDIRQEIAHGLHERSFLILGARRIGKTSLLHQVAHEADGRRDVWCLNVDAQGCNTAAALAKVLCTALEDVAPACQPPAAAAADDLLDHFQRRARERERMPVLLLNEIDGLLQYEPSFVQRLRARHEDGRMRFVFTGYATVRWALDDLASPLYHFTTGDAGNHFTLGPLQDPDCRELIAKLTEAPLLLQWADSAQQERGEALLTLASHRVPWVLQDVCGRLLTHITAQGRSVIGVEDVRQALTGQVTFLERLEGFDVAAAMGYAADGRSDNGRAVEALHSGGLLILHLLMAQIYGWGEGRQTRQDRMQRDAADLGFSAAQAHTICQQALAQLPLLDQERHRMLAWLRQIPWKRYFDGVTLSLILGNTVRDGEHIWFFQDHIYPDEWDLAEQHGHLLENRILSGAARLCRDL